MDWISISPDVSTMLLLGRWTEHIYMPCHIHCENCYAEVISCIHCINIMAYTPTLILFNEQNENSVWNWITLPRLHKCKYLICEWVCQFYRKLSTLLDFYLCMCQQANEKMFAQIYKLTISWLEFFGVNAVNCKPLQCSRIDVHWLNESWC